MTLSDPEQDQRIRRMLDHFAVDPGDTPAFEALEEHLFLSAAWSRLAGVYEARLSVLPRSDAQRAEVLLRLAELLSERMRDVPGARRRYEELLRGQPQNRRGLCGLRRLYAGCGELSAALQIAELEEALVRTPDERAALLAETGDLWLRLGDHEEARRRLAEAVEIDPTSDAAARSFAELALREGRNAEAIELCERRAARLSGSARADAIEQLVRLLGSEQPERQRSLLREVVRAFPQRRGALELLIALEREAGDGPRVDELQRLLWRLARDAPERLQLALEAATYQLEDAGNVEAATFWVQHAQTAAPRDARVLELRMRLCRRSGQAEPLVDALEQLSELVPPTPTRMLEIAALHARIGRHERALTWLERMLAEKPGDAEGLALLDTTLGRLGRSAQRAAVLEQRIAAALDASEAADLLTQLGELCALDLEDARGAEAAWRRALERAPDHERSADQLTRLLRKQDRADDLAAQLFQRAQQASGSRAAALYCEFGRVQLELRGDDAAARAAFLSALGAEPRSAAALAGLRELALASGDLALSLEVCERELGLDPEPARSCALLAELVSLSRRAGDLPRARRSAQRWADLEASAAAFEALADATRAVGDAAAEFAALRQLESLLGDAPERRATVLERLAELVLERSEGDALERAAEYLAAALKLAPNPEIGARLADLYRRGGQLAELTDALRAQLRSAEGGAEIPLRLELARALAELGDPDAAIDELEPAFAADPCHTEVCGLLEALLDEQDRVPELVEVLGQRLAREREPARRRELARHQAALLLDGLERPEDAVAVLRELADPSRDAPLERLFGEALAAAGNSAERESWLSMREAHLEGDARVSLLLELSALQDSAGRGEAAIATLQRAQRLASAEQAEAVHAALHGLLHRQGTPAEQIRFLDELLTRTSEPAGRAGLLLERARLRLDGSKDDAGALADLDEAQRLVTMGPAELRVVARLLARAGSPVRRARALDLLHRTAAEPGERRAAGLELAWLWSHGPAEVRDADAAERLLASLLEQDAADAESFDLLAELYASRPDRASQRIALVRARLALPALRDRERPALARGLAELLLAENRPREAAAALGAVLDPAAPDPALDEALDAALAAAGDHAGRAAHCRERAGAETGALRGLWLQRWLVSLDRAGEPASTRLEALDALLSESPEARDLIEARIALLRECGTPEALAAALEGALSKLPDSARRRGWLMELLDLCEGPLANPRRALAALAGELERAPELAPRAVRLAAHCADPGQELRVLERAAAASREPEPALIRRLGLARARLGPSPEAEAMLWSALEREPRDLAVVDALEDLVRSRGDRVSLLRLLGARFGVADDTRRPEIAREAWQLASELGEREVALIWLRRACALGNPDPSELRAWLELERAAGDRLHALGVLELLLAVVHVPAERADLLAQQAEILEARGQLHGAAASWREALALESRAPVQWLRSLERLCERLGQTGERARWIARLIDHPETGEAERGALRSLRAELLASDPRLRGEAAALLSQQLEAGGPLSLPEQRQRAEQLLALYDQLGRDAEWCTLAGQLAGSLEPTRKRALERERARRLADRLDAVELAVVAWSALHREEPDDVEAIDALLALFGRPGSEAARMDLLEKRAALGGADAELRWFEAAQLRWQALGDAAGALRAAEQALAIAPDLAPAHALRSRLCGALGQTTGEAESLRAILSSQPQGPESPEHWLRLAQLASTRPDGRDEALGAARRALEGALEPASRREIRAVFEHCGAWEEAATLLRAEVQQEPATPGALRALARIEWDELHRAEAADQALEGLARSAPLEHADAERWAAVRAALGDRRGALAHERHALELSREPSAARWLGLAHQFLHDLDEPATALDCANRALAAEPRNLDAIELRARIHRGLGRFAAELDDCALLAELLPDGAARAEAYARAGEIAAGSLGDDARAWVLFRSGLRACSSSLPALLGAGRIAALRGEWSEAERLLGLACELLPGTQDASRLPEVARSAAAAAEARNRLPEACRYLELALSAAPGDTAALEALAALSLRTGAYERAQQCLEARLASPDLDTDARGERLVKLAQAAEGCGALARAAEALEQAVGLRPQDEVWRARAVDLLERVGEIPRAIAQLAAWAQLVPEEDAPRLAMRAAQLELRAGNRAQARERLAELVKSPAAPPQAWSVLAQLALDDQGLEAALQVADSGLERVTGGVERAALLWIRSRALADLGDRRESVRCACEALRFDPTNVAAARVVASQLGQVGNYEAAVHQLERVLDVTEPPAAIRAELWEAIGRAYAGPLENLERAQHCYRRSLEANPLRAGAREALADVTAFDPGHHRESLALHRELLEAYPSRPGSWRSLVRIAEHWRRSESSRSCAIVLEALGADLDPRAESANSIPLVDTDDPQDPVVLAATEILRAYEEAGGLPSPGAGAEQVYAGAPEALRRELLSLAGAAWHLSDAELRAQWILPLGKGDRAGEELPRRARRRLRSALEAVSEAALRALPPDTWRSELAAQAAARAIRNGELGFEAAVRALIQGWPETSGLRLRSNQDLAAAIQICPPVRSLLLRAADAAIEQLGL